MPSPLAAECTTTVSPACSRPRRNSARCAGVEREQEGGGLGVVELGGRVEHRHRRRDGVLGDPAERGLGDGHDPPAQPRLGAGAGGLDHAAHVHAQRVGRRGGDRDELAPAAVDVVEVQRGRGHPRPGPRRGPARAPSTSTTASTSPGRAVARDLQRLHEPRLPLIRETILVLRLAHGARVCLNRRADRLRRRDGAVNQGERHPPPKGENQRAHQPPPPRRGQARRRPARRRGRVLALGLEHHRRHRLDRHVGDLGLVGRARPTASSAPSPRRCAARRRADRGTTAAAADVGATTGPERAGRDLLHHPHRHHLRRRLLRLPRPRPGALRRQRRVRGLVQLAGRHQRPQDPARQPRRQAPRVPVGDPDRVPAGLRPGGRRRRVRHHRPGRPAELPAARLPRLRGHAPRPGARTCRCRPPTAGRTRR